MTTEEQSTQETAEAEASTAKRNRPEDSTESQPAQAEVGGQPAANVNNAEFSQLLQQQISEAVQPVLAEFRQQVARAVEEQMESDPAPQSNGNTSPEGTSASASTSAQRAQQGDSGAGNRNAAATPENEQAEARSDGASREEKSPGQASNVESRNRPQAQGAGEQEQPQEQPQAQLASQDSSEDQQPEAETPFAPRRLLSGGLHLAEQQGERWLQSMVAAGLTALLSESSKKAAQQRAEQELHSLLLKGFEAVPAGTLSEDLQRQIERTLQTIMRDTIEALFSEDARASLTQHSSEAVGAATHGDLRGATDSIRSAGMTVVDELVKVLRRQWQRVLRLIFKAVLAALENSVGDDDEDATSTGKKALSSGGSAA